jgi:molybdopterin-guanine dinucleotide biosynthesis protein A
MVMAATSGARPWPSPQDKLKITGFYKEMRLKKITQEKIAPFNRDGRLFLNINTPEELTALKAEGV